jgi:cyclopropane-fatty-acyl-phospholipid synthase
MARRFFTAGTMPSHDLLPRFDHHLRCEQEWTVGGEHYARTAEAWLERLDANRQAVERLVGRAAANEWRVFFLACAELWGYHAGREWQVSHYRFAPARELPSRRASVARDPVRQEAPAGGVPLRRE